MPLQLQLCIIRFSERCSSSKEIFSYSSHILFGLPRHLPPLWGSLLEVFIRVIGSISDECHSIWLYFGYVLRRAILESGRLVTVRLKIGYSNYRVSIRSVSVKVRVEFQSVSGSHQLIIGSVLPGTDRVQVFFK